MKPEETKVLSHNLGLLWFILHFQWWSSHVPETHKTAGVWSVRLFEATPNRTQKDFSSQRRIFWNSICGAQDRLLSHFSQLLRFYCASINWSRHALSTVSSIERLSHKGGWSGIPISNQATLISCLTSRWFLGSSKRKESFARMRNFGFLILCCAVGRKYRKKRFQ